jgi:hypothetical protein
LLLSLKCRKRCGDIAEIYQEQARECARPPELIQKAEEWIPNPGHYRRPMLRDALLAVAASRGGTPKIDPRRLGHWLNAAENTIAAGFKLTIERGDKIVVDRPTRAGAACVEPFALEIPLSGVLPFAATTADRIERLLAHAADVESAPARKAAACCR